MKILITLATGVIVILLVLLLIRLRYDRLVKEVWRSLKSDRPTDCIFTEDTIANLEEPVRRYFLHAIEPGTPLADRVELTMSGSFRLVPDGEWLPMQATQIISMSPGFVWKAKIGRGLSRFSGADYYSRDRGQMKFSLWGLIPLVDAHNDNITRSSIGRLIGEYALWLPSALLPQYGVSWRAISDNIIQASFKMDDELVILTLEIDRDGKLLYLSLPRWGDDTEEGNWDYIPFGGEILAEQTFGGYTVPTKLNAGYWFGTERYWAFFQPAIEQARFSVDFNEDKLTSPVTLNKTEQSP